MDSSVLEWAMLAVTSSGLVLGVVALRAAMSRRDLVIDAGWNGLSLLYTTGVTEHERWRVLKQTVMTAVSVYCLCQAPPPPLPTESVVVRIAVCVVSVLMTVGTIRANHYARRARDYGSLSIDGSNPETNS